MSEALYSGVTIGLPELSANLQRMAKMIDEEEVVKGLLVIDKELRDEVKQRAPKGKTGNLRSSIVAKSFRGKGIKGAPAVFLAVDFRKGPHAHLIEFGHRVVPPPKSDFKRDFVPAHPFFRPAVDSFSTGYESKVENMLRGLFDNWVTPEFRFTNPMEPTFEMIAESM